MTDREIITAALQWHATNIERLQASAESTRYRRASKAVTDYGGSRPMLSRRVTDAKRVELAALRILAKACAKSLEVDVIDVDTAEAKPLLLDAVEPGASYG